MGLKVPRVGKFDKIAGKNAVKKVLRKKKYGNISKRHVLVVKCNKPLKSTTELKITLWLDI